jgi:hypothetical protein
MTQRLEQAIRELEKLPEQAQDAIAALILEQIADDHAWDEAFARTQGPLAELAARVRAQIAAGHVRRVRPRNP